MSLLLLLRGPCKKSNFAPSSLVLLLSKGNVLVDKRSCLLQLLSTKLHLPVSFPNPAAFLQAFPLLFLLCFTLTAALHPGTPNSGSVLIVTERNHFCTAGLGSATLWVLHSLLPHTRGFHSSVFLKFSNSVAEQNQVIVSHTTPQVADTEMSEQVVYKAV